MRDHEKLIAFQLADEVVMSVYQVTRDFPREEMFGLTNQIRRAAVSVASNIVEGCAKNSEAEYLRFLDIAYGSSREVEYQIGLALRLGFGDPMKVERLLEKCKETSKVLSGLIRSFR